MILPGIKPTGLRSGICQLWRLGYRDRGISFGISGTTNTLIVESIGDVLIRAHRGKGPRVHGNVVLLVSPEAKEPFMVRNQILVMSRCDPTLEAFVASASAIVLHNHVDDPQSEVCLSELAQSITALRVTS